MQKMKRQLKIIKHSSRIIALSEGAFFPENATIFCKENAAISITSHDTNRHFSETTYVCVYLRSKISGF